MMQVLSYIILNYLILLLSAFNLSDYTNGSFSPTNSTLLVDLDANGFQNLFLFQRDLERNRSAMQDRLSLWPLSSPGFHRYQLPLLDSTALVKELTQVYTFAGKDLPDAIHAGKCHLIREKLDLFCNSISSLSAILAKVGEQLSSPSIPSLREGQLADLVRRLEEQALNHVSIRNWDGFWLLLTFQFPQTHQRQQIGQIVEKLNVIDPWIREYQPLDEARYLALKHIQDVEPRIGRARSLVREYLDNHKKAQAREQCDVSPVQVLCQGLLVAFGAPQTLAEFRCT